MYATVGVYFVEGGSKPPAWNFKEVEQALNITQGHRRADMVKTSRAETLSDMRKNAPEIRRPVQKPVIYY